MTQEELVNRLEKVGIKGQWINSDKYGFSRIYEFAINEQIIQIEWYANYSTVMIGMHIFGLTTSCYIAVIQCKENGSSFLLEENTHYI